MDSGCVRHPERTINVDPRHRGCDAADNSLRTALDDLAWWSAALERARADGELPPAVFRIQAAAAAVHRVEDEAL
jgi:hypothetical protein